MATRGREVLRGKLFYRARKGNGASKKKRAVAAYCGLGNSSDKAAVSAQIHICEDYEKMGKPGSKPKNSIKLDGAKIESSYSSPATSQNSSPAYASAIPSPQGLRLSSSPLTTPNNSLPNSNSSGGPSGESYAFTVATNNGEVHEFRTESENERLRWVKLLQLLVMYPYSVIPEEPETNPITDRFRQGLEAKQYGADSVWPVYILPEEVGSKCGIIGLHILALHNGIPNVSMGHLDIISPTDHTHPVVTWDRDKMRRTGKTGHLVFVEIGRRCIGGPGLVWMYTGYQNDAQALRETLHKFLFLGDGSAVITNTQPQSLYDLPQSSISSVDSQRRGNSNSGYHNHVLMRSKSAHDHDSGFASMGSAEKTPPQLDGPPPVRFDKHPSIYRKRDSEPCLGRRSVSSIQSPPGSFSEREFSEPLFDCDNESSSVSGGVGGEGEAIVAPSTDDDSAESSSRHLYDVVRPSRSHTHPNYMAHAPSNEMSNNEDEYMRMVHPKSRDDYVFMRPASQGSPQITPTIPVPMPQGGGDVDAGYEYNTLQHFTNRHVPSSSSSRLSNSLNYETLPTIAESRKPPLPLPNGQGQGDTHHSNYENHPLPQDLKGVMPRNYRPSYENQEGPFRGRRGSHGTESYENVSAGEPSTVEANSNGNNNTSSSLKKRFSFKRRNSDKETVSIGGAPVTVS